MGRTIRRLLRAPYLAALAILVAGALPLCASASSRHPDSASCRSGTGAKITSSATCKGLQFYQGRTITFIVPTAPGGQYDVEARLIAPVMANYLRASVNVENIASGGSVTGQDAVARSSPDGLTIGMFELGSDITNLIQNLKGLNFNPAHEVMLGGPVNTVALLIASPSSPFKNLRDLPKMSASQPAILLGQSTSWGTMDTQLFLQALGVHYRLVTGFANSPAIVNGFLDNDGNLESEAVTQNAPLVQAGKAVAIYEDAKPPKASPYYSLLAGVPDFSQAVKKYALNSSLAKRELALWKSFASASSIAIGGPSRISTDKVSILRAAIHYALTRPSVIGEFIHQGIPTGYVSGPAEKAGYMQDLKIVNPIKSALGL